jgi:hypothetical protein
MFIIIEIYVVREAVFTILANLTDDDAAAAAAVGDKGIAWLCKKYKSLVHQSINQSIALSLILCFFRIYLQAPLGLNQKMVTRNRRNRNLIISSSCVGW